MPEPGPAITLSNAEQRGAVIIHTTRRIAAALVVAGFALGSAATAHAQTDDERFVNAVDTLGIETAATAEELPAVGHHVCDMLTAGLVGNPNPVPAVRGVVTTLAGNGMSKEQAVGLMRASSAVYCPQFARFMGR